MVLDGIGLSIVTTTRAPCTHFEPGSNTERVPRLVTGTISSPDRCPILKAPALKGAIARSRLIRRSGKEQRARLLEFELRQVQAP